MSGSISSDCYVSYMMGCIYLYQCPNPLCQHVFASQHGIFMHFYHQDNVFCNPPEWVHTNVEVALPLYLPREMPPLSSNSRTHMNTIMRMMNPLYFVGLSAAGNQRLKALALVVLLPVWFMWTTYSTCWWCIELNVWDVIHHSSCHWNQTSQDV
jgi:hypothetical protein